ncbi:hypothetical protein PR202_gb02451 [Eleusine coracana subsp. coracana]|uniref:KIB1-4 beta-propeller domain-containing protein n=1 Tax=Eleusine coracana subsp. coracana TaxID=191504 RepID=A0AAV5DYS1_ELECO|nr:hypothetical protein QOZ80_8BG0668360 [Eleusine coracana subsp. coracana]GJN15530.1 hypothetical protein PR202_gb02451 [Eleusine coracana subsp. coracana]
MGTADGRRRGCSRTAAASSACFPPDLIPEVARRLTNLEDFFVLRASCREYRSLLPLIPSNLASQAPLLLLHHAATDSYALFHLPLRRFLRFRLPRARLTDGRDRIIQFHSLGCRVAITDYATELRVLHPFTGEETCLPIPPKMMLFTDFVLCYGNRMLTWRYCERIIQHCRLQDGDWRVASISGPYCIEDLIMVNGILYVLVTSGNSISTGYRLGVVELSDNDDSVELAFLGGQFDATTFHMDETSELYFCLAQCCGELILLISAVELYPQTYHLFRWKSAEAKWARITSLGGFTLFFNTHYFVGCLGPDHPGIARDCIYFTDPEDEGCWSQYSSVDGCFRRSGPVDLEEQLMGFASSGYWVLPSMC